jgi:hypothetical protein
MIKYVHVIHANPDDFEDDIQLQIFTVYKLNLFLFIYLF